MDSNIKEMIKWLAEDLYRSVPGNIIDKETAMDDSVAGLRMYDAPIVAFGAANDPLFEEYKDPKAIGPWHMSPEEWLPGAKTVISLFFPLSEAVRAANRAQKDWAAPGWLHARIEGQNWITLYMKTFRQRLEDIGAAACVPMQDPRWGQIRKGRGMDAFPGLDDSVFGSSWSERHAAYICGLGTFGLSRGLITRRGIAGRFGSLVTDLDIGPDAREYSGVYDWCINCGACIKRCPASAISFEKGKEHAPCMELLLQSGKRFSPRYGCGLCQTKVPCETGAPGRSAK